MVKGSSLSKKRNDKRKYFGHDKGRKNNGKRKYELV